MSHLVQLILNSLKKRKCQVRECVSQYHYVHVISLLQCVFVRLAICNSLKCVPPPHTRHKGYLLTCAPGTDITVCCTVHILNFTFDNRRILSVQGFGYLMLQYHNEGFSLFFFLNVFRNRVDTILTDDSF